MKKKLVGIMVLIALSAGLGLAARPQTGPSGGFDAEHWDLASAKVVDYLGRKAVMGTAMLKDVSFGNGVIEVDIAASTDRARSYPGVLFRVQSDGDWERVYIRPHRHTLYRDVLQYVAAFNGVDSWQFYNGYGATAPATIPVGEWFHFKIEVSGAQARVFVGSSDRPALLIPNLKHGLSRGALGIMGPLDGTAYFSNFSFREDEALNFGEFPPVDESPGAVRNWEISRPFPLGGIDLDKTPEAQNLGDLAWKPLKAEPGGLVDISHLYPRSTQPDLVYARTTLSSESDDLRRYDIGYSDIATVFLNGRPVFTGDSRYQYRDSSFLGIAGYFDSVYLPLRKGENELLIAVAEASGGWGFMLRDGQAVFALKGLDKKWETPRALRIPESAAYDPARERIYVSNYDAYRPSAAEGIQFISKLTLDGKIEALEWVGGLKNPTGLCVVKDKLYAVERQSVAEIDIAQAKIIARHSLPGAVMPNDIAAGPDGALYVTDSNRATIFRISGGKAEEWLRSPEIGRPNGIAVEGTKVYVGVNAEGRLKSVDLAGKEIRTVAEFGPGVIDGISVWGAGYLLVSHTDGRLFRVTAEGTVAKILDTTVIGRPLADFAFIPDKKLIIFPTFTDNRVMAFSLSTSLLASYRSDSEWDANDRKRDQVFELDKVLDSVGLKPGMTVGEVGAGAGYLVFKLASRVGPSGRVIAEDINEPWIDRLKVRAESRGLANIEPLIGTPEDPLLPKDRLDMAFMHATIHFIEKPVEVFRAIAMSLKPGGKILVIEGEKSNAVGLDGKPVEGDYYPSREGYLELFEKAGLNVDRVDDKIVPHLTLFVLSKK